MRSGLQKERNKMRKRAMLIFFVIVFTIYFSANFYIFFKGYRALPGYFNLTLYSILFISFALTFIAGKILERNSSSVIVDLLNVAGGFWLAFMLYSFLLLLISDIARLILFPTGILGRDMLPEYRFYSYLAAISMTVFIIITGFSNAVKPVTRHYSVKIDKQYNGTTPLRIAAVSDVHLGSVVRKRSLRILSAMLHDAEPDYVFILGDLVDGEINPVLRDDLLESLDLPVDKDHIFAITGNHEYIGGNDKTIPYISSKGIRLLLDEKVELPGGIELIGRKDRDSGRFSGETRMSLGDLISGIDPSRPIIVLDHQPVTSSGPERGRFDLMLSGHTHNGQMWPFSALVNLIYRDSYGYSRDDQGQYIVSSGFGTWGPRVRLGSRAEIIIIDLSFR